MYKRQELTSGDRTLLLRLQTSGNQDDKIIDKLLQSSHPQESDGGHLEDIEDFDTTMLKNALDPSYIETWTPEF